MEMSETLAAWQPLPAETKSARCEQAVLRLGDAAPLAFPVEFGVADPLGTWVVGLSSCLNKMPNASLKRAAVNS